MIELFALIDTQTSGLFKPDIPEENQPHLLQLSCKLVDINRRRVGRFTYVIRPEGWAIEPEAEAVHGISLAYANQVGIPAWFALASLKTALENATLIVGFNLEYDLKIITLALKRERSDAAWLQRRRRQTLDMMETLTSIMRLQGLFGDKYPSLEEAANWIRPPSSTTWVSSHDAEDDIERTEELMWWWRDSRNA